MNPCLTRGSHSYTLRTEAKHLPVSPRCAHIKGHGGAKAVVRRVIDHLASTS